jgi:hypothetical protein
MAECVVPADGDDSDARADGGDERGCRGVAGAVMTNLHDVRVEIVFASSHPERSRGTGTGHIFGGPSTSLGVTESEEAGFAGFAGVAHEEFAERPIAEHDDDAVLVHVVAGIGEER